MTPRVYIETSIPSFYYEGRTEPEIVARRQWTRHWWDNTGPEYLGMTSVAVIDELGNGNYPNKDEALELIDELPLLAVEDGIFLRSLKHTFGRSLCPMIRWATLCIWRWRLTTDVIFY